MGLRNVIRRQSDVQRELDTVRKDLTRLRNDLGEVVNAVSDRSRNNVEQWREGMSDRLSDLNQRYAEVRRMGQRQWRLARREVTEHPVRSSIIALVVGFVVTGLLSMLTSRR
jgi:ElaB/YqjD/DUF883 family membrane-anchored ribosome-binding protein